MLVFAYIDRSPGVAPMELSVESFPGAGSASNVPLSAPVPGVGQAAPLERQLSSIGPLASLRLTPRRNGINAGAISPPFPGSAVQQDSPKTIAPLRSSESVVPNGEKPAELLGAVAIDPLVTSSRESKDSSAEITYGFGAGLDKLPRWQGARKSEVRRVPYININWQDQIELSTLKGLIVDVVHGEKWHGGIVGTMVWGRSTRDLGGLNVPTLQNTLQAGLYLEYALTSALSVGMRFRHDIQNTGVSYGEAYAELELPKIGYLEHDIHLSQEAMNRAGMRRFFGLSAQDAANLGVSSYAPRANWSKTSITYEGFHPTSESTGFVFGATIGRLNSEAANSPLVKNFGASVQREFFGAFLYHF